MTEQGCCGIPRAVWAEELRELSRPVWVEAEEEQERKRAHGRPMG